jgi:hypothetical protein
MAYYETNRQVIHLSMAKRCLDQADHLYSSPKQVGVSRDAITRFARQPQTRYEHLVTLRKRFALLGSGRCQQGRTNAVAGSDRGRALQYLWPFIETPAR